MVNHFQLFLFAACLTFVNSQNCGIQGHNGTLPIVLDAVKESQVANVTLANLPIYNVTSTTATGSSHARYLRVLRYETRYEINSAEPFPEFVQTERTELLVRDVTFTCSDGSKVSYSIHLPVMDENNMPPVFSETQYNVTVNHTTLVAIDAGIYISDADVNKTNAELTIKVSNPRIVPMIMEVASNNSFLYRLDIMVPEEMDNGDYEVVLVADDGKHGTYATLMLSIVSDDDDNEEQIPELELTY